MPLTRKGRKVMRSMKKTYGKRAEQVFCASKNKGTISGVERKSRSSRKRRAKGA